MRPEIVQYLRCPVCGARFSAETSTLRCDRGHQFDVAKQGYVNLLTGRAPAGADTTDMVAARDALLAEGHFDYLSEALAKAAVPAKAGPEAGGLVVDVGAGTGYYLKAVLDALPTHLGVALDVAKAAARRAARAHARADAVVCDIWQGLPMADSCVDVLLDVFAPRNASEFRRVLRPGGALLVVTPRPDHLGELVRELGLIGVDPDKDRRLATTFDGLFELHSETPYEHRLSVSHETAARFVSMGPSAWHTDTEGLARRLERLPDPIGITSSVIVRIYRPLS